MKLLVLSKDHRMGGVWLIIDANNQEQAWLNQLLTNFRRMPGWPALYVTLNQFLKRVKAEKIEFEIIEPQSFDKLYVF